jgi:perosamine synthetase
MSRDTFAAKLKEKGVDSRPFFIPMHVLPTYQDSEGYPMAEALAQKGLNLPSSTRLNAEDVEYIVQIIREISSR